MTSSSNAIVTVAFGHSTEHLDYTFSSFAINRGIKLHAFIIGKTLPNKRVDGVEYHLVPPTTDFANPLREIYFRRLELIDQLKAEIVLVVDSYDVLCLQPLPPFQQLLGDADAAGCVEHLGGRYILGQGYTSNFFNGGVFFWNLSQSRDIRAEIVARGRSHFRTIADDQFCLNEVIHTKYFDRVRILPCQYNYRAYLHEIKRGWPTVKHLDGIRIYHNASSMSAAKALTHVKTHAALPSLPSDNRILSPNEQFWRRVKNRLRPWIVK